MQVSPCQFKSLLLWPEFFCEKLTEESGTVIYTCRSFLYQKQVIMQGQLQVYHSCEASYQTSKKTLSCRDPAHTTATGNSNSCHSLSSKSSLTVVYHLRGKWPLCLTAETLARVMYKKGRPKKSIKAYQTFLTNIVRISVFISLVFKFQYNI